MRFDFQSISAPEKFGAPLRVALRAIFRSAAPSSAPASNPERCAPTSAPAKKMKLMLLMKINGFYFECGLQSNRHEFKAIEAVL